MEYATPWEFWEWYYVPMFRRRGYWPEGMTDPLAQRVRGLTLLKRLEVSLRAALDHRGKARFAELRHQLELDEQRAAKRPPRPGFSYAATENVPQETRAAARAAVAEASVLLGVSGVRLRFFRRLPADSREEPAFTTTRLAIGKANRPSRTVWIRADIGAAQARETAFHEVRHLWQPGRRPGLYNEEDELDATVWTTLVLGRRRAGAAA